MRELTANIIGAAIEVHTALGPGLLESSYEEGTSLRPPRLCGETIMTTYSLAIPPGSPRRPLVQPGRVRQRPFAPAARAAARKGGSSMLSLRAPPRSGNHRRGAEDAEAKGHERADRERHLAAIEARRLDGRPSPEKRHQTRRSQLREDLCALRASAVKRS